MTTAPTITIFVRHSAACKYRDDETWKRCNCRKWLRYSHGGKQHRQKAGTRSWAEAETVKRDLEDQLSGRPPEPGKVQTRTLADAIASFLADKKTQGVISHVSGQYKLELSRLQKFVEDRGVFTVAGLTLEVLLAYRATWEVPYPSSTTRAFVQKRLKNFLRFCYDLKWLDRVPRMSPIKVDEPPTMPLTPQEFEQLLAAIPRVVTGEAEAARIRALMLLMRWSGLAIRDASCLRRDGIIFDKAKGLTRVVTSRQKTGTPVSVPIPPDVARELLAVLNGNAAYVFWTGKKEKTHLTRLHVTIKKVFDASGVVSSGFLMGHRLRDTFAVDLLQKGVPLEEVSKLLGHTSIKTTEQSYAKWVKGRQDRLDSLVSATWEN